MSRTWSYGALLVLALTVLLLAHPAAAQWQIDSKDGSANLRVGFLAQPQAEWLETPDNESTAQNLFLRRIRILFGGKVANKWLFFIETDSPNLGKGTGTTGVKDTGTIFIQDAFFTYDHSAEFKVDAGMILVPMSHNHGQSAATLLPVDYGPYSFLESGPMQERVGRDYGVQLRGYPAKQKFEYRVGVFQGVRGTDSRNGLRVMGRAVFWPFGADTGFFYGGTWQGTRRILGIGAFIDGQKSYRSYGADVIAEYPFANKMGGLTGQFNWMRYDGDTFLVSLPKQDTYQVEAAVHLGHSQWAPFVQYGTRDFNAGTLADTNILQAGVAWWMKAHNRNLKVGVGRQHTKGLEDRTQVQVQLQIFYY